MRTKQYLHRFSTFLATAALSAAGILAMADSATAQRGKGQGNPGGGGGGRGHQKQVFQPQQQRGGGGGRGHQVFQPQQQRGGGNVGQQWRGGNGNGRVQQQWHGGGQPQAKQPSRGGWVMQGRPDRAVQNAARHQQRQQQMNVWRQQQAQAAQTQRQQQMMFRQQRQNQFRQQSRQQQVQAWQQHRQQVSRQPQFNAWQQRQQRANAANQRRQMPQNRNFGRREQFRVQQQPQQQWAGRNFGRARDRVRDIPQRIERRSNAPVQIIPGNGWSGRQWGQWNASMNRQRRDDRKAMKRWEKEQRRYSRVPSRDYNFYDDNYSTYYNYEYERPRWTQVLLRTVIARYTDRDHYDDGYNYGYYGGYDGYYAEPVYPEPRYYASPIFVDYSPDYAYGYGSGYGYGSSYGYGSDYGYGPDYYDAAYGYEDSGLNVGGLFGQFPIQELLSSFMGDGFVSELIGNMLVQGYDEGFLAGQMAHEYGYGDRYYDNPYIFEGGFCDPHSVSMGYNRELLGEGYAMGFQDALSGRDDYDPYSDGTPDLVTALLSGLVGRV